MEGKADIRNPLRYLLMNAVASRSVSGSFQLPLTHRLVLRALEAGECLSAFKHVQGTLSVLLSYFVVKKILRC